MNTENKMVSRRKANWILAVLFGVIVMIGVAIIVALSSDDSKAEPIVFYVGALYEDCGEVLSDGDFVLSCDRVGVIPSSDTPVVEAEEPVWELKGQLYGRCHIVSPKTGMETIRLVCVRWQDELGNE